MCFIASIIYDVNWTEWNDWVSLILGSVKFQSVDTGQNLSSKSRTVIPANRGSLWKLILKQDKAFSQTLIIWDISRGEKAIKVYRDIAQLPSVEGARISSDATKSMCQVELKWKQKDIDRGKRVGYARSYVIQRSRDKMKMILWTETSLRRLCGVAFANQSGRGSLIKRCVATVCLMESYSTITPSEWSS